MTGPRPLACLTLVFDPAQPNAMGLELDIGEPADGVTAEDLTRTLLAAARMVGPTVAASWDRQRAERN